MIAVAGGIILALLVVCVLVGFVLMIRSFLRTIARREVSYNISNVRGARPSNGKRWVGVFVMLVVVIGVGYVVNATTRHNATVEEANSAH
jgi:hypothetical protein